MVHVKKTRIPCARVLYAAAVAAILSACSQTDSTPAPRHPTITSSGSSSSGSSSELPEVVITASRKQATRG